MALKAVLAAPARPDSSMFYSFRSGLTVMNLTTDNLRSKGLDLILNGANVVDRVGDLTVKYKYVKCY